ncbi:MAG TPA: serine/threonine-protein kinase [Polyangiaceae bacterium]|nr:serine/threonine-protein kinase [Polyangiaceae bacterium]
MRDRKTEPSTTSGRRREDPLIGVVLLNKYRILSTLASGGMGTVYRAEQLSLRREVAIKVTDKLDEASRKRFIREASILAKIQHPHILTVYDYGPMPEHRGGLFMAMELLQGQTLRDRLKSKGYLSPVELIQIMHQVARGLRAAHRQNLVHRDLKPSNLMLVRQDDGPPLVKILDFGLVKLLNNEDATEVTQAGSVVGSAQYVAPEMIVGAEMDHRADIYAFGIIMFQALAGRAPFDEPTVVNTLRAHVNNPVPPIVSFNEKAKVPPSLESLIRSCLAKSPADRPSDMDEVGRALHACEWELGSIAHRSLPPASIPAPPMPVPRAGLAPWKTATAIVVSALLASLGTWTAQRKGWLGAASPTAAVLHIESQPPGASVRNGSEVMGTTPLEIPLDNASLARTPLRLSVQLDGHTPVDITQGPARENQRVVVVWVPSLSSPSRPVASN